MSPEKTIILVSTGTCICVYITLCGHIKGKVHCKSDTVPMGTRQIQCPATYKHLLCVNNGLQMSHYKVPKMLSKGMSTLQTQLNAVSIQTEPGQNWIVCICTYVQQETVDPGLVHGSSLFIIKAMCLSLLEKALLLPLLLAIVLTIRQRLSQICIGSKHKGMRKPG